MSVPGGAQAQETDEDTFVRAEDIVCLASGLEDEATSRLTRGYLAAEGYGARLGHLEPDRTGEEDRVGDVPNELWKCAFRIAQCCTVHELRRGTIEKRQSRPVLVYGHAVQLQHLSSGLLLGCMASYTSSDKQSSPVGLLDHAALQESCWFTVHPVSQQRSDGEKVREGDEVVFLNVANERYMSVSQEAITIHRQSTVHSESSSGIVSLSPRQYVVKTSFYKCSWNLEMFRLGSAKEAAIGYANGGDIISLVQQGRPECLSVPLRKSDKVCHAKSSMPNFDVTYSSAREEVKSLWRVELPRLRYGGAFTRWGQPFRLRHVITGYFLCVRDDDQGHLTLRPTDNANATDSLFCFRRCTNRGLPESHEGKGGGTMGEPCVKFGDSSVFLQHCESKRWLGYQLSERSKQGQVPVSASATNKARLLPDSHPNFSLSVTRATEEQIRATMLIHYSYSIIMEYVTGFLQPSSSVSMEPRPIATPQLHHKMQKVLDILYKYFDPSGIEDQQVRTSLIRKRQSLFMKQGTLMLVVSVMDRIFQQEKWSDPNFFDTQQKLYRLLVRMIAGNTGSCTEFATKEWLDKFMHRLSVSPLTDELLNLLCCILEDSPQAIHLISEEHIILLVNLLASKGRDKKVLTFLSSLCVLHGVAIRDKQRNIAQHLLQRKGLFLHTSSQQGVVSYFVKPAYLSKAENSALSRKWYYEVDIKHHSSRHFSRKPFVRVGWAHVELFKPFPSSNGFQVTSGGVGHDLFSVGCDGGGVWVGECRVGEKEHSLRRQNSMDESDCSGYTVGCCVDLDTSAFSFYYNGRLVGKTVILPQLNLLTPTISVSGGVSFEVLLGSARPGDLSGTLPPGYTPLSHLNPKQSVSLCEFTVIGNLKENVLEGPTLREPQLGFVPSPIDTSKVIVPDKLLTLRDSLAEHIHDVWSRDKVKGGWRFAKVRNNAAKEHPCLKSYAELSEGEKRYDFNLAFETLATLIGLGYEVAFDTEKNVVYQELDPALYQQSNGYLPRPLDLSSVSLPQTVGPLIERMAENIHNVWAADRIGEGWTYGVSEDPTLKQNPAMVPYQLLDEKVKDSNRSTALETIKSLYAFGARLISPDEVDHGDIRSFALESIQMCSHKKRTIRGQNVYAGNLATGKWYFEVHIMTPGSVRVGWVRPTMHPSVGLGEDEDSFAFDGCLGRKLHVSSVPFGHPWEVGDIIGCLLDSDARTMCFSIKSGSANSVIMCDTFGDPIAFAEFEVGGGFVPAVTLGPDQKVEINFGKDKPTHLQELERYGFGPTQGYVPVCRDMFQSIPLWFSCDAPQPSTLVGDTHPRLTLSRHEKGYLQVAVKEEESNRPQVECLRLSNYVTLRTASRARHSQARSHRRSMYSPEPLPPSDTSTPIAKRSPSAEVPLPHKVSYKVHIPSEQDPRCVLIGWTAPDFTFSPMCVASVMAEVVPDSDQTGQTCLDQSVRVESGDASRVVYSSCVMVPLLHLLEETCASMLVEVTCSVDCEKREIEYAVDGKVVRTLPIQLQTDVKLYPTVLISPTPDKDHLLSFVVDEAQESEAGYTYVDVVAMETSFWARSPPTDSTSTKDTGRLAKSCLKTGTCVSTLVPWEDRVFPLRDISEERDLTQFHVAALKLCCALCTHSYGDSHVVRQVRSRVLSREQLLHVLQVEGTPHQLRAMCIDLAQVLMLQEMVIARLSTKYENVVPLPSKGQQDGCPKVDSQYCWGESKLKEMKRQELSPVYQQEFSSEGQEGDYLFRLKDIAFHTLSKLLRAGEVKCSFLSRQNRTYLLKPLIEVCDHLLVAGVINTKEELQFLLSLLSPTVFQTPPGYDRVPCGIVTDHLEEPIKLAICRLLQHICDCQVQKRVQFVVAFSDMFVGKLKKSQEQRFAGGEGRRRREFMSTPEQQVDFLLTPEFVRGEGQEGVEQASLEELEQFHSMLCEHSGVSALEEGNGQGGDEEGLQARLRQLYDILLKQRRVRKDHTEALRSEEAKEVPQFRRFVADLMMSWAQIKMAEPQLVKEVYSLLYRQYNGAHEVAKALQRTYMVPLLDDHSADVNHLLAAVGSLRGLLMVGMGQAEEGKLRQSLKRILRCRLFKDNPDLMRFLQVHQTTLSLLKDYLGVSEVKGKGWKKRTIRKKSASIQGKVSEPVQACCDFLHSFTSVSQQNQAAMFEHLDFMLRCTEQHPELLECAGHSPLDVATETIRSNDELVIFLRESHLDSVVKLLSQQFTNPSVQAASVTPTAASSTSATASLVSADMRSNDVWALNGAEKCLDFLINAVCCKGMYIKNNALVVIRLLLRYSECLDPIISNPAGLSDLFRSAVTATPGRSSTNNSFSERLDSPPPALVDDSDDEDTGSRKSSEYSGMHRTLSGSHRVLSHSATHSSFISDISLNYSWIDSGEGATLRFLSHLLRLLGYCAPPLPREAAQHALDNTAGRKLSLKARNVSARLEPEKESEDGDKATSTLESIEVSIVQQTHSLLRSLIDRDDILRVLSLPLTDHRWEVFDSSHKEACLMFFDRVYSIDTSDKLLQFIEDVATSDIKFAIDCNENSTIENLFAVIEYITSHLLPVMSTRHHLLKKMDTVEARDTLETFLGVCYQLSVEVSLSPSQRDKMADFLTTFCRALKPRLLVNLMPKLLSGVPQLEPKNIAALKFLAEHFSHFRSYYHIQSGFGVGGYGAASEEEHRFTAAFCFRILHNLCFKSVQPHVVHYGAKCLKSLVSAIHPGMAVMPTDLASGAAAAGYHPRKVDVSKIKLNEAQELLVERFCVYLHDVWARDQLDGGWQPGKEFSKEMQTHPELVPFEQLPAEKRDKKLRDIAFYLKVTLYCGWGVVPTRASASALPLLQRSFTYAPLPALHGGGYNPSPVDLSVQLSPSLNDMSRKLAKLAHEQRSFDLMRADKDYQKHPEFKAFETLDDDVRQEKSQLPLELLKFIVQSGFDVVRNRSQTWTKGDAVSTEGGRRFATEFFSKVLSILATPSDEFPACKMKMVATVVLPMLSQFLSTNAILYHSASSDKTEEIPREEKSLIIKLLPQMWSVCQQNYKMLCIRRTPAKCRNTELNISTALQSFTALTKAVSLKDFSQPEAGETQVLQEFLESSFHELDNAKSLDPKDPSAVPTLDFTFRVVIPSLTAFFRSLTRRRNAKAAQVFMTDTTMRIFQCLCEFARNGLKRYSFIESDVHVYVGHCLGTIVLAHPSRLLDASDDSLGVSLPDLTAEVERAGKAGKECSDTYYIVDIVLPLLCSYLEKHWIGPLSTSKQATSSVALATSDQFSSTVVHTLHLIWSHFGREDVPWMYRAVNTIRSLLPKCSFAVLTSTLLPMGEELQGHTLSLWQDEVHVHMNWETSSSAFGAHLQTLMAQYGSLARDLLVFCSLLVTFLSSDQHKASLSAAPSGTLTRMFSAVEKIYHAWFTSPHFKREFLSQQTLFLQNFPDFFDHLTDGNVTGVTAPTTLLGEADLTVAVKRTTKNVLEWCVRDLLGLRRELLNPNEVEILNECSRLSKEKMQDNQWLRMKVLSDLTAETHLDAADSRHTVQKGTADKSSSVNEAASVIVGLVKLEHRLKESECPVTQQSQSRWKKIKVLTDKRRKAIVSCFMAVPFFRLSVHRAMNLFLRSYPKIWLENMQKTNHLALREKLVTSTVAPNMVHPLTQLMDSFTREAVSGSIPVELFYDYMTLLTLFCNVFTAEDEMDEEDPTKNYKKFAELRASLRDNQSQLSEHGTAVMLLQVLASTGGQQPGPVVQMCLHLGVALLKGGNETVQKGMLEKLRTMDAEVLKCIEGLILGCSVLHWDGHESAGRSSLESHAQQGSLPDYQFIWSLFRFLQLLCEEHYEDFQNYLRTQDSNSTSIDIVCCTVDYLLRLQESLSDYCWYLTEDGVVGTHRKEALNRGLSLAKQVMRTLTEYIQGPCHGNQQALAASRLWDATPGFLKLFASLQWKLGKDTTHIELMLDLMKVQKSLFTLLQSMLEGVETNDPTAQKMANMFIEDAQAVKDIMKFFCMFLELKDLVTAQAFRQYDQNGDGWISRSEFQSAMRNLTSYSREEIDYMMDCADLDRDGKLDYMEFTHRFHSPAEQIGFCLCVLITTLSDHLPGERRLECFRDSQSSIFKYFDKSLGRIEIVGKRGKVERVYFEIKPWWMEQWMERQVQESKKNFLQGLDVRSQREKLGAFIGFCEDTIFEIRHAAKINEIESVEEIRKAEAHLKQHFNTRKKSIAPNGTTVRPSEWTFSSAALSFLMLLLHYLWLAKGWLGGLVWRKAGAAWRRCRKAVEPKSHPSEGEPLQEHQKHDHHSVDAAPPTRTPTPLMSATTKDSSVYESEVKDQLPNSPSKLKLNYDRSKLGSPVDATSTATGGPVCKMDPTQALSVWAPPNISTAHQLVSWSSRLARNYYHLHLTLLVVTVLVNLWLMSFRIPGQTDDYGVPAATLGSIGLFFLSVLHVCVTGLVLLSYYHLKVPVLLFKQEKNITHKLKVSKTWVQHSPSTYKERWDSLVLRSPSFPRLAIDVQLKDKLIEEHGSAAAHVLGMEERKVSHKSTWSASWDIVRHIFDDFVRYELWSIGVMATDWALLFRVLCFVASALGLLFNPFFFSLHLLDLVWSSTSLQNVLKSVMLNYKQMMVTIGMTCVVVYLYTVIAFNMFQKYYIQVADNPVPHCDSMLKCFFYHLNHGLRSGGGIADVIRSAAGDDQEGMRLIFDMTFFFFVIVILLAIVEGLITDSFGKLRNKEEALKEDMQTRCFICGLQKEKLEDIPHGFDQHTGKEHHMAHYMFFLMHLIKKPETEFTGQESHVWDQYCGQKWDFFPVAESFRLRKTVKPATS